MSAFAAADAQGRLGGRMSGWYDAIGDGYGEVRRPDPRLSAAIVSRLEGARSVVNVGAGSGSYEPADRRVVGVDSSIVMLRQRPQDAAPAVLAVAAALPFDDGSFDAALAVLTVHHWENRLEGLAELARVARERVVVFTWDPSACDFWLFDYFPQIPVLDRPIFPPLSEFEAAFGSVAVSVVPVPWDCKDGFLGAYWQRPAAYLEPRVRAGISTFAKLGSVESGLGRLAEDLESGAWESRYGHLLVKASLDLGYRLVVAVRRPPPNSSLQPTTRFARGG